MGACSLGRRQAGVITLDTSAVFALANRRDKGHKAARKALIEDAGPHIVPAGILAEMAYLIESRLGGKTLDAVLESLETGSLALDCGENDLARIRHLVRRYADLPLGFADAAVVACAERHGGRVLTFDRRDFTILERDADITVVPTVG
jgi:uncharacterized protein